MNAMCFAIYDNEKRFKTQTRLRLKYMNAIRNNFVQHIIAAEIFRVSISSLHSSNDCNRT